jgi:glycosyltransferase involved in cell wall biosynthesis
VIPTKDSADLLRDCLASVAWADEIIVVDMFSTDDTAEVCAAYPQCVLHQRQDLYLLGNVNFGFDQARSDWVMRLDTDERITPELADEIRELVRAAPADVTGYQFWERPIVMGRELRHGYGRRHHRKMLFRRGSARYPLRTEHDDLKTSGTWLHAQNGYLHFNYDSVSEFVAKVHFYTDRDVARAELPARRPPLWRGPLECVRALYLYVVKWQGFRDGRVGLMDAGLRGYYQVVQWRKLRHRFDQERAAASNV